jgi:hypothetical protein
MDRSRDAMKAGAETPNQTIGGPTATLWRRLSPRFERAFHCRCERPVFFGNTRCLACGTELGYDSAGCAVVPIEPAAGEGVWRRVGAAEPLYRLCANRTSAVACSWLIEHTQAQRFEQCRSCRLNRTLPDLSQPANPMLWARVEREKQRLVAALIAFGLPVAARTVEDPERGLAFDLLHGGESATPVMIGHADGIITIDVREADDAHREAVRDSMAEPYRTVLGHLRHESGHYYWDRLIDEEGRVEDFRRLFGDESVDYAQALQNHYASGGQPASWQERYVSAFASSHPWEDWAETWAHYLHISDTLDTALSFGLDAAASGLLHDPFSKRDLSPRSALPRTGDEAQFLAFINAWIELTAVLNELSRCMGGRDFYPCVLSAPAVAKLHLVHRVVSAAGDAATAS